jgi:hypothetical protein
MAGIVISLDLVECVNVFDWEHLAAPGNIEYLFRIPGKKKPSAR